MHKIIFYKASSLQIHTNNTIIIDQLGEYVVSAARQHRRRGTAAGRLYICCINYNYKVIENIL